MRIEMSEAAVVGTAALHQYRWTRTDGLRIGDRKAKLKDALSVSMQKGSLRRVAFGGQSWVCASSRSAGWYWAP